MGEAERQSNLPFPQLRVLNFIARTGLKKRLKPLFYIYLFSHQFNYAPRNAPRKNSKL